MLAMGTGAPCWKAYTASMVRATCTTLAITLARAKTPILRRLLNTFCKYELTPYSGSAAASPARKAAICATLSMVKAPKW